MTYDATHLDEQPRRTGDRVIDALIAAATAEVAHRPDVRVPEWAADPARTLTDWWHPGPPGTRQWSIDHAPAAFHARRLAIEEDSLGCV